MDCQQIERDELVEQYIKGQLDSPAQDQFEIHMLQCTRCLQAVEVLQTAREELATRADEIRTQDTVRRSWFRWEFAAALVVLLIALGVGIRRYGHPVTSSGVTAAVKKAPPPAFVEPPKSNAGETPTVAGSAPSVQPQPQPKKKVEVVTASPTHALTNSGSPSQDATNTAPPSVPLPPVPPPAVLSGDVNAKAHPKLSPPQSASPGNEGVNEEVAAELFRLGDVQAPAYTFSGFAASLDKTRTPPRRGSEGAVGVQPGQAKIAEGRAYFQDGMGAYVEKRYRDAVVLLEGAVNAEPNAPDINFYLGVCRLMIARPAEAIAPRSTVIANPASSYTQSAHFYIAKAYIQTSDLARAEEHLRVAAAMPGRMSTLANSTLTKLEAVRARQDGVEPPKVPKN